MSDRSVSRIGGLDLVRGLALAGMIVFHGAWDLHAFGLSDLDPGQSPMWRVFGHGIASIFLFLSGFGLVLAHDRGASTGSALRRIGLIAAAAAAVSIATWIVAPGQAIRFGVLHCIALGNLLALPLLRGPPALALLCGVAALLVPAVLPHAAPPQLWWIGLTATLPDTLDVRPLLPWWGVILLGVAFGKIGGNAAVRRLPGGTGRGAAVLRGAGRRSLGVYLLHQPVLIAILLVSTGGEWPRSRPADLADGFVPRCVQECIARGPASELCDTLCACVQRKRGADAGRSLEALAEACVSGQPNPVSARP